MDPLRQGRVEIAVGTFGHSTTITLDGEPMYPHRLVISAAVGEKTQVLMTPPTRWDWPIFTM